MRASQRLAREEVKSGKSLLPIDIQKHDVGWLARRQPLEIVRVAYFADDFHSRPAFDQHPDARAHDNVVVDEQNPDRLNHSRGSRSRPGRLALAFQGLHECRTGLHLLSAENT